MRRAVLLVRIAAVCVLMPSAAAAQALPAGWSSTDIGAVGGRLSFHLHDAVG
jgi:hypothetical protein